MSVIMARLVERMSLKTVINRASKGTQTKFWIAGTKFDKWSCGDNQDISMEICKPQEVETEILSNTRWAGDNSIDRILIKQFNGQKDISRWELNKYGIKFFKDREHAEKYFLEQSHKLIKIVNPMIEVYHELYNSMRYRDKSFLEELEK